MWRIVLLTCVQAGFVGCICSSSWAQEKLQPLAVQTSGEYTIQAWCAEPIDLKKLTTRMSDNFDFPSMMGGNEDFGSRLGGRPSGGLPSVGQPNAGLPLPNSHILGLQVRGADGFPLEAEVAALTDQSSEDDLGNKSKARNMGPLLHVYQWDRPYLVALPVAAAPNAKQIVKLEGTLAVHPSEGETFVFKASELKNKDPKRVGSYAIAITDMKKEGNETGLIFSLFSPQMKFDSSSRDSFRNQVEAMTKLPEVRATLVTEDGTSIVASRNASFAAQRKFDATTVKTLERELTLKLREKEKKKRTTDSSRVKVSYELNIHNFLSVFRDVPAGSRIKHISLKVVKSSGEPFNLKIDLQNIPLATKRTERDLELACIAPERTDSQSAEEPNMQVEKLAVDVDVNGNSKSFKSVQNGTGARQVEVTESGAGSISVAGKQQQRTWRDASGGFSVEATLVSADSKTVVLKKKDGKTINVPLTRLSKQDQDFLKQ